MELVGEAVKAKEALAAASVDLLAWEKTPGVYGSDFAERSGVGFANEGIVLK